MTASGRITARPKDLLTHLGVVDIPRPEPKREPQMVIQIGGIAEGFEPVRITAAEQEANDAESRRIAERAERS